MSTRHILVAALLAATAAGAMAQDLDPGETLQARNVAAAQAASASRTGESVRAETRNLQAQGELGVIGEKADAPAVPAVRDHDYAGLTRVQVKGELAQWRTAHPLRVGELG